MLQLHLHSYSNICIQLFRHLHPIDPTPASCCSDTCILLFRHLHPAIPTRPSQPQTYHTEFRPTWPGVISNVSLRLLPEWLAERVGTYCQLPLENATTQPRLSSQANMRPHHRREPLVQIQNGSYPGLAQKTHGMDNSTSLRQKCGDELGMSWRKAENNDEIPKCLMIMSCTAKIMRLSYLCAFFVLL